VIVPYSLPIIFEINWFLNNYKSNLIPWARGRSSV
jgi:hypothetical protein